VQFDQRQPESMGVVTSGQNTEQISTITGATTQDRQRTGASIHRTDDVPLHRPQSPGQIRIWIVVTVVPGVVVANEAHSANLPGVSDDESGLQHRRLFVILGWILVIAGLRNFRRCLRRDRPELDRNNSNHRTVEAGQRVIPGRRRTR